MINSSGVCHIGFCNLATAIIHKNISFPLRKCCILLNNLFGFNHAVFFVSKEKVQKNVFLIKCLQNFKDYTEMYECYDLYLFHTIP